MPKFLRGTSTWRVKDFRLGSDLVKVCNVFGLTPLKTQKYLSSKTRRCWNCVMSETEVSDQSKWRRIFVILGQLWVSLASRIWKLLTWSILVMLSWWELELEFTRRSKGSSRVNVQFRSKWQRSLQWTFSSRWERSSPHLLHWSPRSKLALRVRRLAPRDMRWWV